MSRGYREPKTLDQCINTGRWRPPSPSPPAIKVSGGHRRPPPLSPSLPPPSPPSSLDGRRHYVGGGGGRRRRRCPGRAAGRCSSAATAVAATVPAGLHRRGSSPLYAAGEGSRDFGGRRFAALHCRRRMRNVRGARRRPPTPRPSLPGRRSMPQRATSQLRRRSRSLHFDLWR